MKNLLSALLVLSLVLPQASWSQTGSAQGYKAPTKFKLFRSKQERQEYKAARDKFRQDRRAELDKCKGMKLGKGLLKCRHEARKTARQNNKEFVKARRQQRARIGLAVGAAATFGAGAAALGIGAGRAIKGSGK